MYCVVNDNVVMCCCIDVMFLNFKNFDYSVLICLSLFSYYYIIYILYILKIIYSGFFRKIFRKI